MAHFKKWVQKQQQNKLCTIKSHFLVVEKKRAHARRMNCIWITANIEITNLPLSTTPSAAKLWLFWLALAPAILFKKLIVSGCTRSNGQRISKRTLVTLLYQSSLFHSIYFCASTKTSKFCKEIYNFFHDIFYCKYKLRTFTSLKNTNKSKIAWNDWSKLMKSAKFSNTFLSGQLALLLTSTPYFI